MTPSQTQLPLVLPLPSVLHLLLSVQSLVVSLFVIQYAHDCGGGVVPTHDHSCNCGLSGSFVYNLFTIPVIVAVLVLPL